MTLLFKHKKKNIILFTFGLLFFVNLNAQKTTRIRGVVIDAKTKEPMPFVNVAFKGANIGTTTDFDGKYDLQTQWGKNYLSASFVGYTTATKKVVLGSSQVINFSLKNNAIEIQTFTVKADRKRYRNKNNPAVTLIKKVIKHKDENRKEALDYYDYSKYEKIEIDLNNITEKFLNKGWLRKKFQVVLDHIDTSEINGKPYLPIYLRETASNIYYRKNPKALKEYQTGSKMTGFEGYIDDDGMSFIMDKLYQDIDIYDNNINLLSNQFVSPISPLGTTIYKYFIIDTLDINGYSCVNLAFTPRNKSDFAFKGNMYILNDSLTYAVVKIKMGLTDQINLNFVSDLQLDQEYSLFNDSIWMLTKDKLIIDYNLFSKKSRGFFGKKTVSYNNYAFNKQRADTIYDKTRKIIKAKDLTQKTDSFWVDARPDTLTEQEKGVYTMIDSIQKIPAFKRTMDIAMLFITGWRSFGPIEVGPVASFYSFNDVEGFRARLGFRTTPNFSKKNLFESYGAYGFKDKKFKYLFSLTHSFNDNYLTNPQHRLTISYQHETVFPGQDLQFLNDDNFLLSFKRGNSDQMLFYNSYKIDYLKEHNSGFSYNLIYENKTQHPLGTLFFQNDFDTLHFIKQFTTDAFDINLRYAPNEQFYQGKNYRTPLYNKYPIFQFRHRQGISGLTNGEITYGRTAVNIFKRFYLSVLGFSDVEFEAGKIWGKVPYPLLNLPQANQSFFLQEPSFNMMNFMEFLSDEYTSIKITHNFNGAILNKIPLLKRLKWREIISFKALVGRLTDLNNPDLQPDLYNFPTDNKGNVSIFAFQDKIPYIEMSAGISNIFKFFRIDLLQRLTYLDNPGVPILFGVKGLGIRAKGKVDF